MERLSNRMWRELLGQYIKRNSPLLSSLSRTPVRSDWRESGTRRRGGSETKPCLTGIVTHGSFSGSIRLPAWVPFWRPSFACNSSKTLSMAATRDGEVLVLSNTYPEVEYFTRNGNPWKRMCSRTFTGVRQSYGSYDRKAGIADKQNE